MNIDKSKLEYELSTAARKEEERIKVSNINYNKTD